MGRMIPDYDPSSAPAMLVPSTGHTVRGPNGIVSRSTRDIDTPRDLVARDVRELRRVYDIPNSQLQQLIDANKKANPDAFIK